MVVIVSRGDERGVWCVHLQVKRRLLQGVVAVVLARERERSVLRPFSGYCFQFISDSSCRFHVVFLVGYAMESFFLAWLFGYCLGVVIYLVMQGDFFACLIVCWEYVMIYG